MQTLEDLAAQNTAFKDAFNEGSAPPSSDDAMTEDERFGIQPADPQSDAGGDPPAEEVASVVADDSDAPPEGGASDPSGEPPAAGPEELPPAEAAPDGAAMADAGGEGAGVDVPPEELGEPPAPEDSAPKVSYEEALQRLSEDFGPEFVDLIRVVAAHEAGSAGASAAEQAIGGVRHEVEEAISAINEAFASQHFESIKEAHEDFLEVVAMPEFQAWVDAMPPEDQSSTKQVIAGGTARQVIAMLKKFKSESDMGGSGGMDETELDAATGTRSTGGGMSVPGGARPAAQDDYANAWLNA